MRWMIITIVAIIGLLIVAGFYFYNQSSDDSSEKNIGNIFDTFGKILQGDSGNNVNQNNSDSEEMRINADNESRNESFYNCNEKIVCIEGALYCQKDENNVLLEDCQYGCENNSCNMIDKTPVSGECKEVINEHNSQDDNRINIVFLGVNYDSIDDLEFFVMGAVDYDSNNYGLLSVEPFKSNKNKFNFWYINKVQTINSDFQNYSGEQQELKENAELNFKMENLKTVCNFTHQYSILLNNGVGHSFAQRDDAFVSILKENVSAEIPECNASDMNEDDCVNIKDLNLIEEQNIQTPENFEVCFKLNYGCNFESIPNDIKLLYYKGGFSQVVHEFGHSFGKLLDEYNLAGRSDSTNTENINCYVTSSEQFCLNDVPWKNLIGNGCGIDKVKDCQPEDDNYSSEIGCFEGCNYATTGIYRPALLSIMGGQKGGNLDVFNTQYSYRLVNERLLCKRLKEITSSIRGYCDIFSDI